MRTPWDDLKIAFGLSNPDRLWRAIDNGKAVLPLGWSLTEVDSSGARHVVVFRVEVMPTIEDGRAVAAIVRRFGR